MSAHEDARYKLGEAAAAAQLAASILAPHVALFRSPGATFAALTPSESAATKALLGPIFDAAAQFDRVVTAQQSRALQALKEVKAK